MTTTVSLIYKGKTITVQADLLEGYINESYDHLDNINEANEQLKLIGEAIENKSGLPAAAFLKYAKARHKQKTGDAKALGELFGGLDNALAS
jgi:hypothetical protein